MSILVTCDGDWIVLAGLDGAQTLIVQQIPARVYDRASRSWRVPLSRESVTRLLVGIPDITIPEFVHAELGRRTARLTRVEVLRDEGGFDPDEVRERMPVRGTPFEHQCHAFVVGMELLDD